MAHSIISVYVNTKSGQGPVRVIDFHKGTVVFVYGDQPIERIDPKGVHYADELLSGTPLVSNRELAKRTNGTTTHQIVDGGMYQLSRMLTAVSAGSAAELGGLAAATADLISLGHYLLWSGVLPEEDRRAELGVRVIEAMVGRPFVRDPDKLLAADELRRAIELHAKGELKLKAPAARLTFAASQNLMRRTQKLESLERYFGAAALKAHHEIEQAWIKLHTLWRYLGRGTELDHESHPMLPELLARIDDRRVREGVLRQLEHQTSQLSTLFWQPLAALSRDTVAHLRAVQRAVMVNDASDALWQAQLASVLVWRMRMIHEIERGPVAWISVASHRNKTRGAKELPAVYARLHQWADTILHGDALSPFGDSLKGIGEQIRGAAVSGALVSCPAHLRSLRVRLNRLIDAIAQSGNGWAVGDALRTA